MDVHTKDGSLYDEIEGMVSQISDVSGSTPDQVMRVCMGLMARCTEIWVQLIRVEASDRKAKALRTQQLQKVMELIEFEFKAASRLIEVARQEVELSR